MGIGLIGTAILGAAEGVGAVAFKELAAQIELDKQRALEEARHANNVSLEKGRFENAEKQTRLADELKRAPAKEAMAKIEEANKPVSVPDGVGGANMQAPTAAEQRANTSKGLIGSGDPTLMQAGAQMNEGDLNRAERGKEFEVRNAQDQRQHEERMAGLNKQLAQQGAQISLDSRKVDMLESLNALDVKAKTAIDKARDNYMAETDPQKRLELGNTYSTLIGKTGDRLKPIEVVDPVTMEKKVSGFYDPQTGQRFDANGNAIAKVTGGKNGYDPDTKEVFVNGQVIGPAQNEAEARKVFADFKTQGPDAGSLDPRRFTKSAPAVTKKDPLTSEAMTRQQYDKKYGKGEFDKAG